DRGLGLRAAQIHRHHPRRIRTDGAQLLPGAGERHASSLTIPVLLTEAGSRSVPEVIGWGSGRWYDMFEVQEMEAPMALLSHVDVEAEPAWREAVDTVCAVDSGSIGAYNAHAAEMGRRIGELHADMAAEFGVVEG